MGAMSESRAKKGAAAVDEAAFASIADELYALRPDEFAAARDARIKEAKTAGQAPLAKELGALRRPTQSAWLINLLWRDQRDVLEGLLEVGAALGEAQAQASGPELQRLMTQRRQLESALLQRARVLAREAGVSVSDAMAREAQETLSAALADPDVAAEIRSGRLTKPAAYAGFGVLPAGGAAARLATSSARAPSTERPAAEVERSAKAPPPDPADLLAAKRARERRLAAEQEVAAARSAVDRAAADERTAARDAREAAHEQHEVEDQLERLRTELAALESRAARAVQKATTAAKAQEHAEAAHARARTALEQAEAELHDASKRPTDAG
jgi:hypothetical protein